MLRVKGTGGSGNKEKRRMTKYGDIGNTTKYNCNTAEISVSFSEKIRTEFSDRHIRSGADYESGADRAGGLCIGDRTGNRHHDTVSGGNRRKGGGGRDR